MLWGFTCPRRPCRTVRSPALPLPLRSLRFGLRRAKGQLGTIPCHPGVISVAGLRSFLSNDVSHILLRFGATIEENTFRPSPDTITLGNLTACCTPLPSARGAEQNSLFRPQQNTASGGGNTPGYVELHQIEHLVPYPWRQVVDEIAIRRAAVHQ